MSKTMWMVRAGEGGFLFNKFRKENLIVIGWQLNDLSSVKDSDDIKNLIKERYPDQNDRQVAVGAGQVSLFLFGTKIGDKVVTYDPQSRIYLIGKIKSGYIYDDQFYDESDSYSHTKQVDWIGEINRDDLSTNTKYYLGAIQTIFKINPEAVEEISRILKGKDKKLEHGENEEELDIIKEDIISKSAEFVKDKISKLDWDETQELVAGVLRAMGYKTVVSAKGPDRGRDIMASADGLGLKDPKIIAEVKHRKGAMSSSEIRRFTGGLRGKDKGLYVSTGGFTREALYEAERSNIPVALVDLDLLVNLIIQYYDNFDAEAKALVPLTKIYWPA